MNFSSSVLGNYCLELEPRNYQVEEVSHELDTQLNHLRFTWADDIDCNIVNLVTNVGNDTNQVVSEDKFWILYFDGYKTKEGSGSCCVLIDPKINKHYLSCRLEFECTNMYK